MKTRLTILIACAGAVLALPASAAASQAFLSGGTTLRFVDVASETNDVTVSVVGSDLIFDDPAAPITPIGVGCAAVNANRVACPIVPGVTGVSVEVNDMNDEVVIEPSLPNLNSNSINAGSGDDKVTILAAGRFNAFGGDGVDQLTGGPGDDRLGGGAGADTLTGNDGRDSLDGGLDNDVASGGPGSDSFDSGSTPDGADAVSGGLGRDVVAYRSRSGDLSISLDDIANDGAAGEGDNVQSDVEDITSGGGNDTLTGSAADNRIQDDSGGNDTISGGAGDDEVDDSQGNDTISGGPGDDDIGDSRGGDVLNGDEGDDRINGQSRDGLPDTISGGPGLDDYRDFSQIGLAISLDGIADDGRIDPLEGPRNDNVGADIENIEALGSGADTLIGSDAANQIDGGEGDDTISGLGGADGLFGGDGSDALDGGTGQDLLDSGSGADRLKSRDGEADDVSCGSSADILLADAFDQFPPTCDSFSLGAFLAKRRAQLNEKGKGKIAVACPPAEGIDCAVKVEISKGGKTIAKGKGTVTSGETENVTLKLTKAGRGAAEKADKLKGSATTTMVDQAGARVRTAEPKVVLVL